MSGRSPVPLPRGTSRVEATAGRATEECFEGSALVAQECSPLAGVFTESARLDLERIGAPVERVEPFVLEWCACTHGARFRLVPEINLESARPRQETFARRALSIPFERPRPPKSGGRTKTHPPPAVP